MSREKLVSWGALGLVGLFVVFFIIRATIYKPVKAIDAQINLLRVKMLGIDKERTAFFAAEKALKEYGRKTFSTEVDRANAAMGAMLTGLIQKAGLNESEFARVPVGPAKMPGAKEIGWSIQGEGPLKKVTDLVFLLEQTPALHRLQNLVMTPGDQLGRVRVRFRYVTLVLDPAPDTATNTIVAASNLNTPDRRIYDGIVQRDLLRPYIRRAPAEPSAPPPPSPGKSGPNLGAFKVVSLSEWNGISEVHVRDQDRQQTAIYKPGQNLVDGQVVMIDYRPLPKPGSAGLLSYSRVILKVGNDYWAVERGQTLAEKYQLKPEQLPAGLQISNAQSP